jgi:hypothetical protein
MDSPEIDAELEKRFKTFICKRKGIENCSANESQEFVQMKEEDAEAMVKYVLLLKK